MRGYDRGEVDAFLTEVAEWIERGGEDPAGSERVRDELARVGEQMSAILAEAHEAAREIREEASSAGAPEPGRGEHHRRVGAR